MAEKKMPVYDSLEALWAADPHDNRFRPYKVEGVGGDKKPFTKFVWERNPTTAVGKAFETAGVTAQLIVRVVSTVDDVVGTFHTLDEKERADVLAKLAKVPPPTTTTTPQPKQKEEGKGKATTTASPTKK